MLEIPGHMSCTDTLYDTCTLPLQHYNNLEPTLEPHVILHEHLAQHLSDMLRRRETSRHLSYSSYKSTLELYSTSLE